MNRYSRLIARTIEWPQPWSFIATLALTLGPCVAFPLVYEALRGWFH